MKRISFLFAVLLCFTATTFGQDIIQKEFFSTDEVLSNREALNLTAAQVKNIKKAYSSTIGDFKNLKWDLDAAQKDLELLLKENKVDESKALKQMNKVSNLEKEIKYLRLKMLVNVKNNLTENQQEQLKKITKKTKNIEVVGYNINSGGKDDARIIIKGNHNDDGTTPLYIIKNADGKSSFLTGKSFSGLDPDTIESVTVLKGNSATALYGAEAKNGVVVITKKKN